MRSVLARTSSVVRPLVVAIPDAWHQDAVFRWSSIGAVACLLTLFLGSGAEQPVSLPPDTPFSPLPLPALTTPPVPALVPSPPFAH